MWSLSDISYTSYKELIQSLSAGRYWIQGTFNLTITTGFLFGHYLYPKALLEVLHQAGINHLLIHHVGSNSPYYSPTTSDRLYGEGGLTNDGITPNTEYPSIYRWKGNKDRNRGNYGRRGDGDWRNSEEKNDGGGYDDTDMIISHTYQSQSNLLANLIQYRCKATIDEYVQ